MPSASGPQLVAYELTLVTVAVALTAYVVWRGSADAVVPTFVVELGRSSSVGLRDRLARLLGDPSLVLGFAVGDPPPYVDERGQPIVLAVAPGRVVTAIEDRGTPDIEDWVGALGGTVHYSVNDGLTFIRGEIPCAS